VHKDYAAALEHGRVQLFKSSRPANDFAHMWRNLQRQLVSTCSAPEWRKFIVQAVHSTRHLPTLQLFDAVWFALFQHLVRNKESAVVGYLQREYWWRIPLSGLASRWSMRETAWQQSHVLFAPHWTGVMGTMPGTGSGSQTVESFHSYWQSLVTGMKRADVLDVIAGIQRLYREEWRHYFRLDDVPGR
jgi:hypothetical protein